MGLLAEGFSYKNWDKMTWDGNASLRSDAQNHLYKCELSQGLLKSILDLWWSGGLFLASKGYINKIWAWEHLLFHEKSEEKKRHRIDFFGP